MQWKKEGRKEEGKKRIRIEIGDTEFYYTTVMFVYFSRIL
jgi:hypothetical protein